MALWISFAIMTAVAALAILRPFWRTAKSAADAPRDIEVYRQQLQEIEEEAARGLLGEAEAKSARIEVSRRILTAAEETKPHAAPVPRSALTFYVMAAALPAIALSLYLVSGTPQYAGQPFAARVPSEADSVAALVNRVEERLQLNPDDGMGWNVIAPVYLRLGRYADAVEAYRNASRLVGESAERSANLGEALALFSDGNVDEEARRAFDDALTRDPTNSKARFWLAIAEEQAGKPAEAVAIYRNLLQRQLPEALKSIIRERLAAIEGTPVAAGDTPERQQPAGGAQVETEQIDRMVSGLAERLKQDGSDLKGWLMLVRAYTVLGRKDDAVGAIKKARDKFAGNGDALGQIDALAKSLGLPS